MSRKTNQKYCPISKLAVELSGYGPCSSTYAVIRVHQEREIARDEKRKREIAKDEERKSMSKMEDNGGTNKNGR